jgi:hypothetical protein
MRLRLIGELNTGNSVIKINSQFFELKIFVKTKSNRLQLFSKKYSFFK